MTIYALKSRFQDVLRPFVGWLCARGATANQVTTSACVVSIFLGAWLIYTLQSGSSRIWFAVLPLWMLARMALNAMDGMLAREFGQRSSLGAYLNELSDVVSDAALYLPFAFVEPFGWYSVGAVIFVASLTEMAGVVGVMVGASRRYDGPMGKSDRAFAFSLLAIWVAAAALPLWAAWLMWAIVLAGLWTLRNRVHRGLQELRPAADTSTGGSR